MKFILAIMMFLCISNAVFAVDNEYCSLNLNKDDCITNTTNGDCCWMTFTHKYGYGKDIVGCFDYRFIVNSLKFVTNPKAFDSMSDSDLCTKFNYSCTSVTKDNFPALFSSSTNVPDVSLIIAATTPQCHK
jgi:hypothetical protein